jgi:hypothetical protein
VSRPNRRSTWLIQEEPVGVKLRDALPRLRSRTAVPDTEKKRNSAAEKAANKFAMDVLFGESGIKPFNGLKRNSEIRDAARQLGISPGVAVHQMHRHKLLDYQFGNRLCVDLTGTFSA